MKCSRLLSLLSAFALLSVAGCHSDGPDVTLDGAYLRVPDFDATKTPALSEPIHLLFPTGPTREWQMNVRLENREYREVVHVAAPSSVDDTATLTMFHDGKQYRTETYLVKPDSLSIVSTGSTDFMKLSPPLPILRADAAEGVEYPWEGKMTFSNGSVAARAFSRIRIAENVVTPAGKFRAYRVDTIIATTLGRQPVFLPASRWFVPGIGMVKQVFRVGRVTVQKELQSCSGV